MEATATVAGYGNVQLQLYSKSTVKHAETLCVYVCYMVRTHTASIKNAQTQRLFFLMPRGFKLEAQATKPKPTNNNTANKAFKSVYL